MKWAVIIARVLLGLPFLVFGLNHFLGFMPPPSPEDHSPQGGELLMAFGAAGYMWPLIFVIIPRIVGAPAMQLFTILQHAELSENSPSILESTRSFRTSWLARFLYMNMNNHVEHHLYPQVPFYALPALNEAVKDQVPEPGLQPFQHEAPILIGSPVGHLLGKLHENGAVQPFHPLDHLIANFHPLLCAGWQFRAQASL